MSIKAYLVARQTPHLCVHFRYHLLFTRHAHLADEPCREVHDVSENKPEGIRGDLRVDTGRCVFQAAVHPVIRVNMEN